MEKIRVKRAYKDKLFRFLFKEKKDLLELYNAINGTAYQDEEALEITTLEDVVYIGMKNDTSFIINSVMNLYEHQSSLNPNMPLRGLFYFSKLYSAYIVANDLNQYGDKKILLPAPRYIVFYNGIQERKDSMEIRLSDSFIKSDPQKDSVEIKAMMLNINIGHNKRLLEQCKKLGEYAKFVDKVRQYLMEGYELSQAIDEGAEWCIKHNVLREILMKNRAEVTELIFAEYDEEKLREIDKRDSQRIGREEGLKQGLEEGMKQGMEQGMKQGMKQGRNRSKVENVEKIMKNLGLDLKAACGVIDITVEEYENIKNEIDQ